MSFFYVSLVSCTSSVSSSCLKLRWESAERVSEWVPSRLTTSKKFYGHCFLLLLISCSTHLAWTDLNYCHEDWGFFFFKYTKFCCPSPNFGFAIFAPLVTLMVVAFFFIFHMILARNAMFESWAPWVHVLPASRFRQQRERIVCERGIIEKGWWREAEISVSNFVRDGSFWDWGSWCWGTIAGPRTRGSTSRAISFQVCSPSRFDASSSSSSSSMALLVSLLGGIVLDWMCWWVLHITCGPKPCFWRRVESWVGVESPGRVEGLGRESRGNCAAPALCILVFFWVPVSPVSTSSFLNCSASRLIHITSSKIAKSLVDGMRNFSSFQTT